MDRKELIKRFKQNVKNANRRMDRLEQYSKEDGFKTATQWAYKKAMRDVHKWSGDNARRFSSKPPADDRDLFLMNQEIEEFLNSSTSTKTGIKRVYIQKAETINENYGTNFTWQDLAKFMEKETFSKLESSFTSKTVLTTIGLIESSKDKIIAGIKEAQESILVSDEMSEDAQNALNKLFNGESLTPEEIFIASNAAGIDVMQYLPDTIKEKSEDGTFYERRVTSQDVRNMEKLAASGEIDWEDIM